MPTPLHDPADQPPRSRLDRALDAVPRLLAHRIHILFLGVLGLWLIAVPLLPGTGAIRPSATAELIGGNWTNVSSAIGACIAAGAGLAAHHEARRHRRIAEAAHALVAELHSAHIHTTTNEEN
ncbi:hypothetical protein [Kitasatospora sp. MAA4]|uniref:hypothetical protein n=1 Tax=Kitasatospora sp. MAA4 TaxID=3035093 RepID=UPI0024738AA4|nr:hypothetical protein [Kitasatospora sp. MAA4]